MFRWRIKFSTVLALHLWNIYFDENIFGILKIDQSYVSVSKLTIPTANLICVSKMDKFTASIIDWLAFRLSLLQQEAFNVI